MGGPVEGICLGSVQKKEGGTEVMNQKYVTFSIFQATIAFKIKAI